MMRQVIGHSPSAKTIERRTRRVGAELAARGGAASERGEVSVADVAVVSCCATVAAFEHAPRTPVLAFTKPLGVKQRIPRLNA
jgi:hypothetical protein